MSRTELKLLVKCDPDSIGLNSENAGKCFGFGTPQPLLVFEPIVHSQRFYVVLPFFAAPMNLNRRRFIGGTSAGITAAGIAAQLESSSATPQDPFAPPEPGQVAEFFDKGKQHVLPPWAFEPFIQTNVDNPDPLLAKYHASPLWIVPPTAKPADLKTWDELRNAATPTKPIAPFAGDPANPKPWNDSLPVGMVLHGTAVEWNGDLIGGNMKHLEKVWDDASSTWKSTWGPAASAWEAMAERVKPDSDPDNPAASLNTYGITDPGNWGKFPNSPENPENAHVQCYKIQAYEQSLRLHERMLPTMLYTYQGRVPGPTFRFRHGMPAVVRFENLLQTEISVHHHGGHNPTHSDGFPTYYVLQGQARDYLYPNILPLRFHDEGGDPKMGRNEIDFGEGQSTTWYHDHALDATAFNVSHGLAGFALWFDDLELKLIRNGVLPGYGYKKAEGDVNERKSLSGLDPNIPEEKKQLEKEWKQVKKQFPKAYWVQRRFKPRREHEPDRLDQDLFYTEPQTPYFNPYDLPIVLQDRIINTQTGQIVYDSNGHNGYIGNVQLINGRPWPTIEVKRRKYRLRLLDGSNARIYRLRFLDSDTFQLNRNPDGTMEPAPITDIQLENESKNVLRIGKDSWLYPMPQEVNDILLNMANRADVIVDFGKIYEEFVQKHPEHKGKKVELYLVNTMPQFDGRGPKGKLEEDAGDPNVFPLPFELSPRNPVVLNLVNAGKIPATLLGAGPLGQMRELNQPIGLIKFVIEDDAGEGADASIDESTVLRPRHAIPDDEVMAVREFVFERGKGAWMVNARFYDPTISNASPIIGIKEQPFQVPTGDPNAPPILKPSLTYAEEWVLRNGGGGWWHPIHMHLEGHQLVGYEKDFAADGIVGPDGILGARAQVDMAGLPTWEELAGKYGFDTLAPPNGRLPDNVQILRDLVVGTVHIDSLLKNQNGLRSFVAAKRINLESQAAFLAGDWNSPAVAYSKVREWYLSLSEQAKWYIGPWSIEQYYAPEIALNPAFKILLERPGFGASLMPVVYKKEGLKEAFTTMPGAVKSIWDGLYAIRTQWAADLVANHDTQALGPNTAARIRMRFRTWSGPLAFHCHNVEHEDMRMMMNFEPTMSGEVTEVNKHDPDVYPTARTHGQHVTDLRTNPHAIGEMPWESVDGLPSYRWEERPVPETQVDRTSDPLIKPRDPKK